MKDSSRSLFSENFFWALKSMFKDMYDYVFGISAVIAVVVALVFYFCGLNFIIGALFGFLLSMVFAYFLLALLLIWAWKR